MSLDETNDKYSLLKVQDPMVLYIKGKYHIILIVSHMYA